MSERTLHTQQLRRGGRLVGLRRRRLRVQVVKGPDRKARFDLALDRIVIGTHDSCDVILSDPTVSRQHCEIALVRQGYAIRDLDSTNGTFLDHARVGEIIVDREVRLRAGDSELRITPLDDTVDIALEGNPGFGPLLGRSPAMQRIFDVLARVAPTDATVVITGESGTGKEVCARAIHEASARASGPFVVVDCGALPGNLIESELYGHVRGAFTGAVAARGGAFQTASGGTLFLDELGELPLDLQTRLLGVLERRTVQPLGSTHNLPVDVRVVAATNRDLRREVNRGGFREDLYFRLAVVTVEMPALRDRPEDIPLYVESFLDEMTSAGWARLSVDAATMERLSRQSWRGNVRELRNVLERAAALGEVQMPGASGPMPRTGDAAATPSLPALAGGDGVDVAIPFKVGKAALIEQYERSYVGQLIRAHDGNITRAARAAEIDRVYLLRLLDKFGLRPGRER